MTSAMLLVSPDAAAELEAELSQLAHLTPAERDVWTALRMQRRGGERDRIIPRELVAELSAQLDALPGSPPIGPAERRLLGAVR